MNKQHQTLLTTFYQAFQNLDAATMAACYHPKAQFNDPVFQDLQGEEIGQMWAMLIERSKGQLDIQFSNITADDQKGAAVWEAKYSFSATKRPVHNVIHASFEFQDGKIIRHTDQFDLWKWTRMALGPVGYLLGWSSLLQNKVRAQAKQGLNRYQEQLGSAS